MKAKEFDLSKEIIFEPDKGLTTFRNSRLVIFDVNAIGLLRQHLIEKLGKAQARDFFLQFGYQHGFGDFMQMKQNYKFDNEMDLQASGPVIHSWEGLVQATPRRISFNRNSGDFYFTGVWNNSWEAEQHLSFMDPEVQVFDEEPVCWTLMGYASGWCTAFFGRPLLAIEPICVGCGDGICEWLIKPPRDWGEEARPYIAALRDLWSKFHPR